MPSYLVDEGGERTHAVLPVDEYERLRKSEERLESVRGYAQEIISAMGREEEQSGPQAEPHSESHESVDSEQDGEEQNQDRAWYQRA